MHQFRILLFFATPRGFRNRCRMGGGTGSGNLRGRGGGRGSRVQKQVVIRDGRLAVDRLADAHIPVLYLLAGENLTAPPKSFVEKPQLGAIVDNTRDALLVHAGIVRDVEQAVGVHDHVIAFHAVDLVHDEMEHGPALHPEFIFESLDFGVIKMIGIEPVIGETFFSCSWHKLMYLLVDNNLMNQLAERANSSWM